MSLATLGTYELFWFYANWHRMRRRGHPRISPFWRTFFAYFFCYSLFKTVKVEAASANVPARFSPGFMAIGWTVTSLGWRLPNLGWVVCFFASVAFLVPVQISMNHVNQALYPGHDPNTRFTAWNIAGIVLGSLLLVLAILGSLLPD